MTINMAMNGTTTRIRRLRHGVAAIAATTVMLVGCASDDAASSTTDTSAVTTDSISIELARATTPAAGETTMPVYGILVNESLDPIRIISATSPDAESVDLLGPEGSVVLPAEGFEVLPDGGLIMEPVGFKLMLNGVDPNTVGPEVSVTLRVETGESFSFSAVLQDVDQ